MTEPDAYTSTDCEADGPAVSTESRHELERRLQFANIMNSLNLDQNKETIAIVQALADLLVKAGVIREDELHQSLQAAREQVAQRPMPAVRLASIGDKYDQGQNVEIDCASRIPLCKARCCTFKFYLTKQDLDEGAVRWDYGNPYWIKQRDDGYCVHSDCQTRACAIHARRPDVCRTYDCRNDKRVWLDFENRIPAPMPESSGLAPVAMAEVMLAQSQANETAAGPGKES